jgi:uncharacterized membrane protein
MEVNGDISEVEKKEPWGFDGLLLLLGLGIVISPFRKVGELLSTYPPLFSDGTWDSVTSINSLSYDPYWGTIITIKILSNLVFILSSSFLLFLYFKKKAIFPKWYFINAFSLFVFLVMDSYIVSWIYPTVEFLSQDSIQAFTLSFIPLLLWSPYLFKSERANNTFTL